MRKRTHPTTHAAGAPLAPIELLQALDRWLAASRLDAAAPWQVAIAARLAAHPPGTAGPLAALVQVEAECVFSMSVNYLVAPGTKFPDLLDDAYGLLLSAIGVLDLVEPGGEQLNPDATYAIGHFMRQACGLVGLATSLAAGQKGGAA